MNLIRSLLNGSACMQQLGLQLAHLHSTHTSSSRAHQNRRFPPQIQGVYFTLPFSPWKWWDVVPDRKVLPSDLNFFKSGLSHFLLSSFPLAWGRRKRWDGKVLQNQATPISAQLKWFKDPPWWLLESCRVSFWSPLSQSCCRTERAAPHRRSKRHFPNKTWGSTKTSWRIPTIKKPRHVHYRCYYLTPAL